MMQWQDGSLLAKKILIGIALTILPFVILLAELTATRKLLSERRNPPVQGVEAHAP